jgi:hypothetical protein
MLGRITWTYALLAVMAHEAKKKKASQEKQKGFGALMFISSFQMKIVFLSLFFKLCDFISVIFN